MKEIWFHDLFETRRPEFLSRMLVGKFGYGNSNPGPVVAYPPNAALFPVGIPEALPPRTGIAVPWTRARLLKEIGLANTRMRETNGAAVRAVKSLNASYGEAEKLGLLVDAISTAALLVFGLTKMAMDGYKAAAGTMKEAQKIARGMATSSSLKGYAGVSAVIGISPTTFVGNGTGWQNLLRHSLSLASPSYWASLVASAWTGDWDLWKYGAESVRNQGVARVLRNLAKDQTATAARIAAMERQKGMSFYRYRVKASQQTHPIPRHT